jgi:hypothetical protein
VNSLPGGDALQICEIRDLGLTEVIVTVRNLGGAVFRGARFDRVSDSVDRIDLELTQIIWYGRTVDEIRAGHTALVTLRGRGASTLRSGTLDDGWQHIEGRNSPAP